MAADKKQNEDISYGINVGDKIKLQGNISGIVKYIGQIVGKPEYDKYYGIVFKKPIGDTNGRIKKKIYFKCKPKYGKFVKRTDIVYPFPIIFNELCDTAFHILSSTIFLYFDPETIGNFCKINNNLCKIIFNIDKNYNLTWKKQWKLFISPKSEDNSFRKRWINLYNLYKSTIFAGNSYHQEIGFGLLKITNLKNEHVLSNHEKAMVLLKIILPIISKTESHRKYISIVPCQESLKFDAMVKKIKLNEILTKFIKTEKDAAICIDHRVCGSIYYQHINEYKDIFKNKVKGSKPFLRKYYDRKPLKQFKVSLKALLMPSFLELSVKQWFVINLEKDNWRIQNAVKHSYIIGWISIKKLIVIGGAFGNYKNEIPPKCPTYSSAYSISDDSYWSGYSS